ncbi:hypothetical protein F4803DRAFT_495836 [Xylaria telfairii]|nr:hypothetical protein F4803DRAFT_495836 [Xylaria telfairii]
MSSPTPHMYVCMQAIFHFLLAQPASIVLHSHMLYPAVFSFLEKISHSLLPVYVSLSYFIRRYAICIFLFRSFISIS